jgi:uncharacterized protein YkwD
VRTRTLVRKRSAVVIMALALGIGTSACLPGTGPPATGDDYQRAMLDALNRDRANAGLPTFTFNSKLSVLAGGHACDMSRAGYVFHTKLRATMNTPDFGAYWSLGENVVMAPSGMSASDLEAIWMGSPTHRANILNPNFNVVGIAACFAPDGRVWATQDFGAL